MFIPRFIGGFFLCLFVEIFDVAILMKRFMLNLLRNIKMAFEKIFLSSQTDLWNKNDPESI